MSLSIINKWRPWYFEPITNDKRSVSVGSHIGKKFGYLSTANAKDTEVKKSTLSLGQSNEKLKYLSLKIAQMKMFSLGKSEKTFQIKKFL